MIVCKRCASGVQMGVRGAWGVKLACKWGRVVGWVCKSLFGG